MRSAWQITFASLILMLAGGCSHQSFSESTLPSLRQHQPHIIVQVPADFAPERPRTAPYYVVCDHDGCSAPTPKTPVGAGSKKRDPVIVPHGAGQTVAIHGASVEKESQDSSPRPASPSYRHKRATVLEKYRVHFEYASHRIGDRFVSLLKEFVTSFASNGRIAPELRVTGYTDSVKVPTPTVGNEWLALERATSVKRELVSLGYPENKILLEAKFLCCYLDTNETESGRYNNRRAEISLIQITE